MITFPSAYPYYLKNETAGALCGIAPGATKLLGPKYFEATKAFYASYAETAQGYLISGEFSAKDSSEVTVAPAVAAASFGNVRAFIDSFVAGEQSYLENTVASGPLVVNEAIQDSTGAIGTADQVMISTGSVSKWANLPISVGTSLSGAGTAGNPLVVANPATGTNTGDQVADGSTIIGVGSAGNSFRANVPSTSDGKLYGIYNNAYTESTKTHVGLSNVDNIQQMPLSYLSGDTGMGGSTGPSNTLVTTQLAAKTYSDTSRAFFHLVNVQKNPQTGQFASIAAAVASITDSSETNPYVVYVRPGVYVEPLINLTGKHGVQLVGSAIQGVIIEPDANNHHAITMGPLNEVSFVSIRNVGTGYAGIAVEDSGYYSQVHKVSMTDCSIGVLVTSAAQDTYFYGEYLDINDNVQYGVKISATNTKVAYANLENFYVYPTVSGSVGVLAEGTGSEATISLSGFVSDPAYGGVGIIARDGADISVNAVTFNGLDTSIHLPTNVSYAPCNAVIESVVLTGNTMDLLVEHIATTGFFSGAIEYSKKSIPFECPFYEVNVDPEVLRVSTFGGDFSSIAAAVDSITDATYTKRYIIKVGAGTFTEPLIDLSTKSYIAIQGADTQSTVVLPATGTQHLFKMGYFTEVTNLTIRDVGAGHFGSDYAGILTHDVSDSGWAMATNISFYDCDVCVLVKSDIYNTYFYGQTLDYNGYFGTGIKAVSVSGLVSEASVSNNTFYPYTTNPAGTYGIFVTGLGSLVSGSAFDSEGAGGGIGAYLENGGKVSISSGKFRLWDTALLASDIGTASSLVTKATVCTDNTSYDLKVVHIATTGSFFGDMDSTKASVSSPNFGVVFQDAGTGGFTVSDKLNIRFSNEVTTDISTLITGTAPMGLLSGGALSPTFGLGNTGLGATGLSVTIGSGVGYLVEQTSGFVKKVSWDTSHQIMPPNTQTYIGINSNGDVFSAPSISHVYNVRLGRVISHTNDLDSVINVPVNITHHGNNLETVLRGTLGGIFGTGCIVSGATGAGNERKFGVSSGTYYYGSATFTPSGVTGAQFELLYRDGGTGWTHLTNQNQVPNNSYDNGTGTLAGLTGSCYATHTVYTAEDGTDQKYWVVCSQNQFPTLDDAKAAGLPVVPSFIKDSVVPIAGLVIQKDATSLASIVDVRTRLGFVPNASSGVTVHGNLTGLSADDHTQYLLVAGTRAMSGNLDMGTHDITNVGDVDGVNVSAHAERHLPSGADALATAAGVSLNGGSTGTEGVANSFSRSDHTHAISLTKSDVGLGNVTNESKATMFTNPVFTGTPAMSGVTGLTASAVGAEPYLGLPLGNNYVLSGVTGGARSWIAQKDFTTTATDIKMDGTQAIGVLTTLPRADHVHPSDTSRAPLFSPGLTGAPTAPTAAAGTNTTQLATTAFVQAAFPKTVSIGVTIDNGASVVTTGIKHAYMKVPYNCTITGWSVVTNGNAGNIAVSLLKSTYATFPPTSANNICGSAYITLTSSQKNQSTTGWDTGWTTSLSAGDILGVEVLASPSPTVYNLNVLVDILKS